eukprot:COSAG04_NODE_1312_length_7264_cov_6.349058_7_plen_320_part_01
MGVGPQYNRWTVLAVGLLVETIGGLFYMFGVYSQTLKERSWPGGDGDGGTLTQTQVALIGSASNIGANVGVLPWGCFFDAFGPRPTVIAGGALGVLGWGLLWAALARPTLAFPFWSLVVLGAIQGMSQAITDCATVPTMARLFPRNRGGALGLTKAFVGLSASMATTIYVGVFRPDIESFMAFLAVLIACITVLAAIFYHPAEPPQSQIDDVSKNKAHFDKAYVIAFILVAELLATALFDAVLEDDPHGLRVAMMVGMATIFVVLCWWVATGSRRAPSPGRQPLLAAFPSPSSLVNTTACLRTPFVPGLRVLISQRWHCV